jgi:hypothetical protein
MDHLSDWNLAKIFIRMRPSKWQKFINLGFDYIFDDYFFRKYFRIHNIPKTPQPDFPQLIGWENKERWKTDLSKTPWNEESQNPHWITGNNDNGYTIYYDNWDQFDIIEDELRHLVNLSIDIGHNHYSATQNGYFQTLVLKNPYNSITTSIVLCIRYCPYDAITIGYYLPHFDIWEFNYTTYYYGQCIDYLRWGKGVVKFNCGFKLYVDGWPDQQIMKDGKHANIPPTPLNLPELLTKIMLKYLDWGEKINYFFQGLEDY